MKALTTGIVILLAMALGGRARAGLDNTTETPQPFRLELDLVDGSCLIGGSSIETVPVRTPYARMDIPMAQIRTIKMGDDHETVSVDLRNGDNLTGVISLGRVELVTVFGKVAVGFEHVRELRVAVTGEATREGLIAWYNFDDGTANDSSGRDSHGIVRGAKPAPDRDSRADRAMSFDGSGSWIEVPSSRVYDALAEISIALWACPADAPNGATRTYNLVSKQPSGFLSQQHTPTTSNHGGLFDLDLNVNDGSWDLSFSSQVSAAMCTEGHAFPLKFMTGGRWQHLAVTISRSENRVRAYLNGKKVGDLVYTDQAAVGRILSQPNSEPLRIGKRKDADFHTDGTLYFRGSMDDIRIYSRVLSANEIQGIYDARK